MPAAAAGRGGSPRLCTRPVAPGGPGWPVAGRVCCPLPGGRARASIWVMGPGAECPTGPCERYSCAEMRVWPVRYRSTETRKPPTRRPGPGDPASCSRLSRESGITCFPLSAESGNEGSLAVSRPNRESGGMGIGDGHSGAFPLSIVCSIAGSMHGSNSLLTQCLRLPAASSWQLPRRLQVGSFQVSGTR